MFKLTLIILFITLINQANSFIYHQVPEGYVGIYYTLGRLDSITTDSGGSLKIPWPVSTGSYVQITPQTDVIKDVKCGAGDGTQLIFPIVEVGNYLQKDYVYRTVKRFGENYDDYLVKDKIRAQINVICSRLTSQEIYIDKFDSLDDLLLTFLLDENSKESESGVIVQFVRMSKPVLPKELQANYDKIANEKTALKVAEETKKRLKQENVNKLLLVTAETERKSLVAEKDNEIRIASKTADETESTIENRILEARELTKANALYTKKKKEAEGNKLLLTFEYIELERVRATANNAKHYFGKIPTSLFMKESDNSMEENVYMTEAQLRWEESRAH